MSVYDFVPRASVWLLLGAECAQPCIFFPFLISISPCFVAIAASGPGVKTLYKDGAKLHEEEKPFQVSVSVARARARSWLECSNECMRFCHVAKLYPDLHLTLPSFESLSSPSLQSL